MKKLSISTNKKKVILDITQIINDEITKTKIQNGVCVLFLTHTTAALTTADLDPGTDLDMLDAFSEMIPKLHYRHPHNPSHAPDHILSSLIGTSLSIPVQKGQLVLGTWQRVVLIEFDGPRERNLLISFVNEIN
jgi:secondary thiamine-phosphate synthase enzyme